MGTTVLETIRLTKKFGNVTAIDRLDISVENGEWVAIMGPSGSGKTTLLNILACLDSLSEGQYILDGVDTSTLQEKQRNVVRREKIGLIFQQFHLVPYLTALENVMLAQYYHSMIDRDEARTALERVGKKKPVFMVTRAFVLGSAVCCVLLEAVLLVIRHSYD